jgi:drug/metabolite transporter (DMT)-like permease
VNDQRLPGVFFFLFAITIFAISDATAKYLTSYFSVALLTWVRYITQLAAMLMTAAPRTGMGIVRTSRPWLMSFRALMQFASTLFFLLAVRSLPLAEATALIFTAPLLVALLAGPMLGEKIRLRNWLATVAGFGGVLLIARPGGYMDVTGVVCALISALSYSLYQILTRKLAASEPPVRQLFYIALVGSLAMTPFLPFFWFDAPPPPGQALLLLSLGMFGGMGHFLLIRAFQDSPASRLAPLLYFQLVLATLLGWVVFGHLPDRVSVLGMFIIGAAGLVLIFGDRWRKTKS